MFCGAHVVPDAFTPRPAKCKVFSHHHVARAALAPAVADAGGEERVPPLIPGFNFDRAQQHMPPTPSDASLHKVISYLMMPLLANPTLLLQMAAAMVFVVVAKGAALAVPAMFKQALDALTCMPMQYEVAVHALLLSGVLKAASGVANELRTVCFTPVSAIAGHLMAVHVFRHILYLDVSYYLDRRIGALTRIVDRAGQSCRMLYRLIMFTFVPMMVELVLVCWLFTKSFHWHFAAAVLVTFAIYVAWTISMTERSDAVRKQANKLDGISNAKIMDTLINFETVLQFNNQDLEIREYNRNLQHYNKAMVDQDNLASLLNGGQTLSLAAGMSAVLYLACVGVGKGTMTVGDLVMANGLLLQLWAPLQFLGYFYREFRQCLVDMESVFDTLRTHTTLPDGTIEFPNPHQGAGLRVKLQNVKFGYNSAKLVLRGINLEIASGQSVAVVGPSGSGKSTLVALLLRLYDTKEGHIRLNDFNVMDLTQKSLREAVAVVPQDTVLFSDTVYNNILFGKPTATEAEVIEAAKMAELHEAILAMPHGYKTEVGTRGLKLSGGEKQRIAIARAFLKAPRLLICDEATSALDSATESAILQSLKVLAEGRTCLFIAHRLSTIVHCDNIIVMEKGQIVEQGSHTELLRLGKIYRKMWELQQSEDEVEAPMNGELTMEEQEAVALPNH
eukprot:jgi/Mesvir1/19721/Mv09977-RA.1